MSSPRSSARPEQAAPAAAVRLGRLGRLPWLALLVVALVLLSAPFALDPIRDAATLQPVGEAVLRRPVTYLAMAPVSGVLDTLTLLSVRQHIALVVTLLLGWALWWWWRGTALPATVRPSRRAARIAARVGIPLLALVALYTAVAILPRPMAAIDLAPNLLAIDFHSHTSFSHDGRPDWTPEDNRAWHRDAGFAAAYITDHRTFEGARDGWANNPPVSGEGVTLLPAIEVVWRGEHVNLLDADRMFRGLLDPAQRDVDEQALKLSSSIVGNEPVLIETIPGDLSRMVAAAGPGTAGVRAVEIVDGAPRGLQQGRRERTRIVKLADSLNLALVAGSDHHGWGHTAAGWTLMHMPGWRAVPAEQLSLAISTVIRRGGFASTRVVERYVANTDDALTLPLTLPLVTWGMMRTLSTDERVVWLFWTLAIVLLLRLRAHRRAEPAPRAE